MAKILRRANTNSMGLEPGRGGGGWRKNVIRVITNWPTGATANNIFMVTIT